MFGLMGVARMAGQPGGAWSPLSLFANGELGGDFTRISLTKTFSDTAGTTSATVNGSVASVRSAAGTVAIVTQSTGASQPKLRGTPQGADLAAADGNFFTPANWTPLTGVVIDDATATATTATGDFPLPALAAEVGKTYLIYYAITRSAGDVNIRFGGASGVVRSAAGTYREYVTAVDTSAFAYVMTGFSGTVSNLRVWDASNVAAPYWLDFDGADDSLSGSLAISAYPFSMYVMGQYGAMGSAAMAIWQSDSRTKYIDVTYQGVDWDASGQLGFLSGAFPPANADMIFSAKFGADELLASAQLVDGTPVSHSHSAGSSTALLVGKAFSGLFYSGRIYGFLAVDKILDDEDDKALLTYMGGDWAIQAWGDSMTAGSGVDVALGWPGRLQRDAGIFVQNQGQGGQDSSVILTRFNADTSERKKYIQVIWAGNNNDWAAYGWSQAIADIAEMVAGAQGRKRYLVIGVIRGSAGSTTGAALDALDAILSAQYGERFLDIRALLAAENDGSVDDLADIADGITPRSLRSDTIHLNDKGYQLVAQFVREKIEALGWGMFS